MKQRLTTLAMFLTIASALLIAPFGAAAAPSAAKKSGSVTVPVTGTVQNGGTFDGNYTITKFVSQGRNLFAIGTLSGTLKDVSGATIGSVSNVSVRVPVTAASSDGAAASADRAALAAAAQATCTILDLTLGPLDLNLLGLMVHLNQVHLVITAQQGGGLLGDLLCAVANLLNGGGPLGAIANLLNQILAILNGL